MTSKIYAYTITNKLYIISIVTRNLSTIMVGWENSEVSAKKAVENLDEFYPCGKPEYVIISKACKRPNISIQEKIWYRRDGDKYRKFVNLI